MTIEVCIQHPYSTHNKDLLVTTYNPKTGEDGQKFRLVPGSSRMRICLYDSMAYKVEEVDSADGRQQS